MAPDSPPAGARPSPHRLVRQVWQSVPLKARDFLALSLPVIVILLTSGIAIFGHTQRARVEASLDRHGRMVTELNRAMLLLVDAETGMRGFLLTRRPDFLEPYNLALRELPPTIARIRELIDAEAAPEVQARIENQLSRIDATAAGQLADLAWQKRFIASRDYDPRVILQHMVYGKSLMDSLRRDVATLQQKEAASLEREFTRIATIQARDYLAVLLTLAIGLGSRFATRYFYTTRVLVRLRRVVLYLRALRRGRYPGRLAVGPADVIGDLEAEASLLGSDLHQDTPWDPHTPDGADPLPEPRLSPTRF